MCERDVGMAPQAGEEVTGTVDAELWKTSRISRNIHCRAQQSKHIVGWCVRKDAIRRKQDLLKPEAALEEAYNCLGENPQGEIIVDVLDSSSNKRMPFLSFAAVSACRLVIV